MAYLTPTELIRLGTMRPEMLSKLLQLMNRTEARTGKKVYIPEDGGTRLTARQAELVSIRDASGEDYPVAPPGSSYHEYGAAADPHIVGGTDDDYRVMADEARLLGLTAGYYWAGKKKDPYHVQLNEPLDVAKSEWAKLVKKNSLFWRSALASLSGSSH